MRSHWVWVRHLYQAFQLPVCPTGSGWRFFPSRTTYCLCK